MPQTDTEKLQTRNRELSILNAIADALNREVDLARALDAALTRITDLFDLGTAWVWLRRDDTGETYLASARGLPPGLADHPARMDGGEWCVCLEKYALGALERAANISLITCTRLSGLTEGTDGLRHHASVPLYHHDKRVGVLNVVSADWRELSEDDLRLLNTVGDMLSIAVERAQLFARSAQLGAAEERNRLAREIHDTLAQGLTAIALQLETADALLETPEAGEKAQAAVRKALGLARANLEEARRSVLDLRAAPLEGCALPEAITKLLNAHAAEAGWETHIDIVGGGQPLTARLETGLYRIAQEALTNIARHAQAEHVTVELVLQPDKLQLTIEDDGVGFDTETLPEGRFGLVGLNERARLLGGLLTVCSEPDAGTTLHISIPLESGT